MATLKDMDICLPELKRMAKTERRKDMRAAISFAIDIITHLPAVETGECVPCKACFYYQPKDKVCGHKNGLIGRVKPEMFCSYGTLDGFTEQGEDEPEVDFSELEGCEDDG